MADNASHFLVCKSLLCLYAAIHLEIGKRVFSFYLKASFLLPYYLTAVLAVLTHWVKLWAAFYQRSKGKTYQPAALSWVLISLAV